MSEEKEVKVKESELRAILDGQKKDRETITALSDRVNELIGNQKEETHRFLKANKDKKTVRVRFVDNKPVIGFKNRGTDTKPIYVYEKIDPNDKNNRILMVDLLVQGVDEPIPVDYNEFMREGEIVQCEIKSEEVEEWKVEQGEVRKKEIDGYSMIETDIIVPVEVRGKVRKFTVALPDGAEITLDEKYVNI